MLGDTDEMVGVRQPTTCAFVVALGAALPVFTVTVAVSVGSPAGGATVAVICVVLSTVTLDTGITVPLGVLMMSVSARQVGVATELGMKPLPVMVIE